MNHHIDGEITWRLYPDVKGLVWLEAEWTCKEAPGEQHALRMALNLGTPVQEHRSKTRVEITGDRPLLSEFMAHLEDGRKFLHEHATVDPDQIVVVSET